MILSHSKSIHQIGFYLNSPLSFPKKMRSTAQLILRISQLLYPFICIFAFLFIPVQYSFNFKNLNDYFVKLALEWMKRRGRRVGDKRTFKIEVQRLNMIALFFDFFLYNWHLNWPILLEYNMKYMCIRTWIFTWNTFKRLISVAATVI